MPLRTQDHVIHFGRDKSHIFHLMYVMNIDNARKDASDVAELELQWWTRQSRANEIHAVGVRPKFSRLEFFGTVGDYQFSIFSSRRVSQA